MLLVKKQNQCFYRFYLTNQPKNCNLYVKQQSVYVMLLVTTYKSKEVKKNKKNKKKILALTLQYTVLLVAILLRFEKVKEEKIFIQEKMYGMIWD